VVASASRPPSDRIHGTMGGSNWHWSKPLAGLLLGGLLWRSIVAWTLPAGFDEVYYYLYSRHLSWSYFDHPPIVALTTGAGWWLTGVITPFTIRLGALLIHGLSLGLLYLTTTHLYSRRTGFLAVAIATLVPLFWLGFGVLTSPDNALILFWSLVLYGAAVEFFPHHQQMRGGQVLRYEPSWRLALLGMGIGLATLSKYHGFILGAGLLGFCRTRRRTQRILTSPWMGLAAVLGFLVLMPLWIWNGQHDWISFRFHLFMRFDGGDPRPYRILDALVTGLVGIAYLWPTLGFPLWWVTGGALWRQLVAMVQPPLSSVEAYGRDRDALILWVSLPIALGFTLLGGKQQIYPAWPAPGLWGLTVLLAHSISTWRPVSLRRWLGGSGVAIGVVCAIALLHLSFGIFQTPGSYSLRGGFVPVEQDGSTTLLNVTQLRRRLAETPAVLNAIQQSDFVFTDEFYLSGYVDMAVHPLSNLPVTCFSQDPRGFAFWFDPENWVGQSGVYVTLRNLHPTAATEPYEDFFEALLPLGEIDLTRGGITTETVLFYQAETMIRVYAYPYS
jgi:4-amino-4-deoxy-L-arabinose transferase-like glycosyltransferase